jgi:hypothetical protein
MTRTIESTRKDIMDWLDIYTQQSIPEVAAREDITPGEKKSAVKKFGKVKFADAKNNKYPIDTEAHVRAAMSYFSNPKNFGFYSPKDRKAIASKIATAAKRLGIEVSDDYKAKHKLK